MTIHKLLVTITASSSILWGLSACSKSAESAKRQVEADFSVMKAALEKFKATARFYPTTSQGLKALVEKPEKIPIPRNWNKVMEKELVDPWGNYYVYRYPGALDSNIFEIISKGPDGKQNFQGSSSDDISSQDPASLEKLASEPASEITDPNVLSNEKVRSALGKRFPNCQFQVLRIHEIPIANAAEGEIEITSFHWSDREGNPGPLYSGPAKITLQKLTTGWQIRDLSFRTQPQAILVDPIYIRLDLPL